MEVDLELGVCHIDTDRLVDHDPRDGECFGLLQGEIDKMSSIHAASQPDWNRVATLAGSFLREEGKDFTVAGWLVLSWVRCMGLPGLVAGSQVLADLHRHHWQDMAPLRIRGRRNQLEWLLAQLEKWTGEVDANGIEPQASEELSALAANWADIDDIWRSNDDQSPSLAVLTRWIAGIPHAQAESELKGVEAAKEASVADDAEPRIDAEPVVPTKQPSPAGVSAVAVEPPMQVDADALTSQEEIKSAVSHVFTALRPILAAGLAQAPTMPLLYRLSRTRVWADVEAAPPDVESVTRLPPPTLQEKDSLARLLSGDDALALLRYAEGRLAVYRFWLDLNRASHEALSRLPEGKAAASVVARETAGLLLRLPRLADLSFNDEHPFADSATKAWLRTLSGSSSPAGATAPSVSQENSLNADETLELATAIAAASAQTESAQSLLVSALERLQGSARNVAKRYVSIA